MSLTTLKKKFSVCQLDEQVADIIAVYCLLLKAACFEFITTAPASVQDLHKIKNYSLKGFLIVTRGSIGRLLQ